MSVRSVNRLSQVNLPYPMRHPVAVGQCSGSAPQPHAALSRPKATAGRRYPKRCRRCDRLIALSHVESRYLQPCPAASTLRATLSLTRQTPSDTALQLRSPSPRQSPYLDSGQTDVVPATSLATNGQHESQPAAHSGASPKPLGVTRGRRSLPREGYTTDGPP